eukprot:scaffold1659_cov255-Pinguiococcus_pyrenoidosus.AAC.49
MHPSIKIALNLRVEAAGSPVLPEERNRHRRPKAVQLQTAGPCCAHDAGIVDDLHVHSALPSAQHEIRVGRRT